MKKYSNTIKSKYKKILIVHSIESPNSVIVQNFDYQKSQQYFVHWIISYYQNSFFHIPYGYYEKAEQIKNINKNVRKWFVQRTNATLAIISNCNVKETIRLKYIVELKKYFQVDTFGECFDNEISDLKRQIKLSEYKFYLSFENTQCDQYITEKYWEVIKYGIIPIVMGFGSNIKGLIPESYINVFDFPNPKSLAHYLHILSTNENEYSRYHQWRKYYYSHEYKADSCKILSKITEALQKPISEDPTVYLLGDKSNCLSIQSMKKELLKT
ncbi:hypothetical protein HZS_3837 [Henneguya salminicola]|nr:hypothetical protein HZS_3837 [Henneguya salminicola]